MPPPTKSVHFGLFELDPSTGELRKEGIKLKLHGQPVQVLSALLEHPGDVVTRDALRQRLWPSDTFVDFEHNLNSAVKRLRETLGDSADTPHFVETLPRHGYRFIGTIQETEPAAARGKMLRSVWIACSIAIAVAFLAIALALNHGSVRKKFTPRSAPAAIESLAVLSLENLSGNPQQEYFSDGMTEELITELARFRNLRVISRQSVLRYKSTSKSLPQIAEELGVDALLQGSTLRDGDRVRITVQLVRAAPEEHLWAQTYERELRDVISLERDVVSDVVSHINIALGPQAQMQAVQPRSVNPAAFEAYLQGSYAIGRTGGVAASGLEFFQKAIALDPSYAQAYVGLCLAYIQMSFGHGPLTPKQTFAEMKHAINMALQLDQTLADAHACLAWEKTLGEWDWAGAEAAFRRAIELSPNSAQAHRLYSWYLSAMKRSEEAIGQSQLARRLDPASLSVGYSAAAAYWWSRQYRQCASVAEDLYRSDPTFPGAFHMLAGLAMQSGSYQHAIDNYQRAIDLTGQDVPVWQVAQLACANARFGKRSQALKILATLESESKRRYVTPYAVAYVETSLGDKDRAIESLEKAYAEHNPMLTFLQVDPLFDDLRPDPRFQNLIRRMRFPHQS